MIFRFPSPRYGQTLDWRRRSKSIGFMAASSGFIGPSWRDASTPRERPRRLRRRRTRVSALPGRPGQIGWIYGREFWGFAERPRGLAERPWSFAQSPWRPERPETQIYQMNTCIHIYKCIHRHPLRGSYLFTTLLQPGGCSLPYPIYYFATAWRLFLNLSREPNTDKHKHNIAQHNPPRP